MDLVRGGFYRFLWTNKLMIPKSHILIPRLFLYSFLLILPFALAGTSRTAKAGHDNRSVLSSKSGFDPAPFPGPTPVRIPVPGLGVRVAVELLAPIEPVRALGHEYLLYELKLTNYYPADLRLNSVEVFADGLVSAPIAAFSGRELEAMVAANPWGTRTPHLLTKGAQSIVFFTIALEPNREIPARLRHRLEFEGETGSGRGKLDLDVRPLPVSRKRPPVFEPPVRGSFWYAHSGPANKTHHRRTLAPRDGMLTMDQRFGIDFFLLNQRSDGEGNTFYVPDWQRTLDAQVFAVAAGKVVKVVDGLPEEGFDTKSGDGIPISWDTIGGNLVVIEIGDGQFVWYEHLKAGSIVVKEGDNVRIGEKLGVIGTSGNAGGAPHLHFEFTDSMELGTGNGIPYVFPCFEMPSILESFPDWDELIQRNPLRLGIAAGRLRSIDQEVRRMEIPLAGSIMSFPENGKCGE